ncbi:MAG: DUF120 domain-containing protein [Halobacteriota archaeon]
MGGYSQSPRMPESVTGVGYDELATLKLVALDSGLSSPTKVSCSGLAARLDASNQTASRRLQRLEEAGYVDREVVNDGQWITITEAGEAALRAEYTDYKRVFEDQSGIALVGTVTSGMGEGRHYISLPGYKRQFEAKLGYEPFAGTLNVMLEDESVRARPGLSSLAAIEIDSWESDDRTFGAATCYPAAIESETGDSYEPVHIIVPDRTHHDEHKVELIAPDRLRDELDLADGDPVEIYAEAV